MRQLSPALPRRWSRRRLWCVPPALLGNPARGESFEGELILGEIPGEPGLRLWECYRDARLWVGTPPELRRGLFVPAATRRLSDSIRGLFDVETRGAARTLLQGMRRLSVDDGSMAAAALTIASTAKEGMGASATALAYTQLAAAIAPTDPAPALAVGQLASELGYHRLAEQWLRRAIALARRSEDWVTYGVALLGVAQLREEVGQLREARRAYTAALRHAKRRCLPETRGRAVAGLLRVAVREGNREAAEHCAARVLRQYGPEHPRRGSVLLDVAVVELEKGAGGDSYDRVAELLQEAWPLLTEGGEQVRALTLMVRAAGGAGDRHAVVDAWHRASALIDGLGDCVEAVRLRLDLARAGAEVLEDAHADVAARRALECAGRLNDATAEWAECKAFLGRPRLPSIAVGVWAAA